MTRRTKKMLSLLLATAMVFTMNTAAFAKETKGEAELADATLTGGLQSESEYQGQGLDKLDDADLEDLISKSNYQDYSEEHILKDFKAEVGADGSVTLKNVTNPISWCNVRLKDPKAKTADASTAAADVDLSKAIIPGYEGGDLIETVLSGATYDDQYLLNKGKLKVSDNNYDSDGLVKAYRTYDVVPLDDSHFLFVGYGQNREFVSDALNKFTPVFEYDGRKIAYNKSGLGKANKGSNERLNVAIALVKYENNTVTKIPGVTVGSVKVAKDNKNATVSGQAVLAKSTANVIDVYNTISEKQPSFTIKAKIDGKQAEAKAQKKAITKALKDDSCKYTFDISQYVVAIPDGEMFSKDITAIDTKGGLSANELEKVQKYEDDPNNSLYRSERDRSDINFAKTDYGNEYSGRLNMSKLNAAKNKGSLALNVDTWNGKKWGDATIKIKAGAKGDYTLEAGSLAGTDVSVLNFKENGNFIYKDARTSGTDLASAGYKYCFRATPSTDKKDKKKFRIGFYRNTDDGFCYSVK